MRYPIGKVAKTFGFTKEALRFYERAGILIPQRDENGYRYYTKFQLQRVAVIKRMQNIGFSLKEIAAMLTDYSEERLLDNLRGCIAEKEQALAYQQVLLERLRQDVAFYEAEENMGRVMLTELPQCYFLYFDDVEKLVYDDEIRPDILRWYDKMYPALGVETVRLKDMGSEQMPRRIGLIASREDALSSGFPLSKSITCQDATRALCYCQRLRSPLGWFGDVREALETAAADMGVICQGQVHIVFNFSYRDRDGEMVYLIRVYAPIEEK